MGRVMMIDYALILRIPFPLFMYSCLWSPSQTAACVQDSPEERGLLIAVIVAGGSPILAVGSGETLFCWTTIGVGLMMIGLWHIHLGHSRAGIFILCRTRKPVSCTYCWKIRKRK